MNSSCNDSGSREKQKENVQATKVTCSKNNMRLTERDKNLLAWINSVGFVSIEHIARWMKVTNPVAYRRAKKLLNHGYLSYQQIFLNEKGMAWSKLGLHFNSLN